MNIKELIPTISTLLVIIGAINWGLVGLFHFNLVEALFGSISMLVKLVYALVGLAGLYSLSDLKTKLQVIRR